MRIPVRILSYALMNNHVHLVAVPEYGDSLSQLFRSLSGSYAQFLNASTGTSGRIWQSRYFSAPMSQSHLHHALRYVEMNPVRAGLVANPANYRWTSAASHYSGDDPYEVLDMSYLEDRGGPSSWVQMIETTNHRSREIEHCLRACTYAERPFGGEEFVVEAEERLGRTFQRWPFDYSLASDEVTLRLANLPE